MGVGFDRNSAQGTEATAPRNPFVSLVSPGSVRPGYIVTRNGVWLGMTPELVRDFAFGKLSPSSSARPGAPEWSAAPMSVSVDGVDGSGTSLMDTGNNYMFLSPPAGTRLVHGTRAPPGTRIAI